MGERKIILSLAVYRSRRQRQSQTISLVTHTPEKHPHVHMNKLWCHIDPLVGCWARYDYQETVLSGTAYVFIWEYSERS